MEFDGSLDLSAVQPLSIDADSRALLRQHVDFVVSNEIVVVIGLAVELHVMILERVVGPPPDSSRDVEAGVIVAVAVDDFEVFGSSEIVGSVECRLEVDRRDLDSVSVRSLFGPIPYDYSLDVEPW